jgi:hypothetical protein
MLKKFSKKPTLGISCNSPKKPKGRFSEREVCESIKARAFQVVQKYFGAHETT